MTTALFINTYPYCTLSRVYEIYHFDDNLGGDINPTSD